MIKGIGVDILDLSRIEKIIAKGDSFAKKVLTPAEFSQYQEYSGRRQVEYLGGRFSCKESFSKAWGTGIGKAVSFQDVETLQNSLGQPIMTSTKFSGKIWVSISHEKRYVITQVLLED
ncbi:holo-[acyl-carrier protein] synthase [Lactobacillus colini]|uniref:Holo-[acyl-carrier-protein] synthase n=1 Tax=Lactobacillus colini TaxID=1819254 RepID=A0ABS4MC78_9LACO|nr:holo-ACP synthase [Lactobacillus colini]MBP2057288.1 holo-[acyl-carrier protein] synthase [Lactobacillus colini]